MNILRYDGSAAPGIPVSLRCRVPSTDARRGVRPGNGSRGCGVDPKTSRQFFRLFGWEALRCQTMFALHPATHGKSA